MNSSHLSFVSVAMYLCLKILSPFFSFVSSFLFLVMLDLFCHLILCKGCHDLALCLGLEAYFIGFTLFVQIGRNFSQGFLVQVAGHKTLISLERLRTARVECLQILLHQGLQILLGPIFCSKRLGLPFSFFG